MQRLTEREKSKSYCSSPTVIEMACDVWRANLTIEELKDFFICTYPVFVVQGLPRSVPNPIQCLTVMEL